MQGKTFPKKIILASASPRRYELMKDMGLDFEVIPADVDESGVSAITPRQLVKKLSALKAGAIETDNAAVIGADTVVAIRNKVYGKPHNKEGALLMLGELCGRWHTVYTGVTVQSGDEKVCFSVRSRVKLKSLTDDEIERYVDMTSPFDKAGAYGIQDGIIVEKYKGSYSNIVGLPVEKLALVLARLGVTDGND